MDLMNMDNMMLVGKLGQGSFGSVFSCIRQSDKQVFAMKCESLNAERPRLPHEANVLLALNLLKSPHFVEMIDNGQIAGRFQFVIIRLVGQNLWDVRLKVKQFTLSTSLMIGIQTLAALRDLHRVGWLHRDIKPPNFCIGRPDEETFHTIFILDFGLCRKIALKGKDIRTPRKECAFRGTTRYASLAAHDSLFRKCCYQQMHTILLYLDSLQYGNIPDYDFIYHQVIAAASVHRVDLEAAPNWDQKAKSCFSLRMDQDMEVQLTTTIVFNVRDTD
uniref:Protein kinase domain-containing protein n=1 Tax=Caenorhabditis tropicalis TaxID=1561998 RepID=A0A1I7THI2_9PELO